MSTVIVIMEPGTWKRGLRDVIVVIVVTRDGSTVDGGGKREEKEESTSEGGEHRADLKGAAQKGSMAGNGSPYKEGWQMVWSIERHLNSDLPPPKCCSIIFPFSHLTRKAPTKPPRHLYPPTWPGNLP
jgi:hypothetical protein